MLLGNVLPAGEGGEELARARYCQQGEGGEELARARYCQQGEGERELHVARAGFCLQDEPGGTS